MKNYKWFLGVLMAFTLVSCANISSVETAPFNEGVSRSYQSDYELVKAATLASMQNLNINIKKTEDGSSGFMILFTKSISAFSWGEVGRVMVVSNGLDGGESRVYVHSEKRYKPQVTGAEADDFADAIFSGIEEALSKR